MEQMGQHKYEVSMRNNYLTETLICHINSISDASEYLLRIENEYLDEIDLLAYKLIKLIYSRSLSFPVANFHRFYPGSFPWWKCADTVTQNFKRY